MKFSHGEGLSFDDVLIVPQFSDIGSRKDPNTQTTFFKGQNYFLNIPILAANMDTVTEHAMMIAMYDAGASGVIHRFMTPDEQVQQGLKCMDTMPRHRVPMAIGTSDGMERAELLIKHGFTTLVIDIAHGHSKSVIELIKNLKSTYDCHVVAGNVATPDAVRRLEGAGADAVKVGIGPGAACSTRAVAGVGYPQLSAIWNCSQAATVPIIADGGIKTSGDIAKAIAAGASAVMIGSLLAGTTQSPGTVINNQKVYRGMASFAAQVVRAHKQGLSIEEQNVVAEGESGFVPYVGDAQDLVRKLNGGLKSAMSYVGAKDLQEFRNKTEFVRVTQAGIYESSVRVR